jgi:hypothetical protein
MHYKNASEISSLAHKDKKLLGTNSGSGRKKFSIGIIEIC